jgi:hypothetical protein
MIKKLLRKWGLSGSEKQIETFLHLFTQGDIEQNGMVLGWAALLHYQIMSKDPEFESLLNSKKGENQGPVRTYILQLNRLGNQLQKAGRIWEAAGMNLWNMTFRCMSDESLHHHGLILWKTASISFPVARNWLENESAYMKEAGSERDKSSLSGALKIYNFIPPQFVLKQ